MPSKKKSQKQTLADLVNVTPSNGSSQESGTGISGDVIVRQMESVSTPEELKEKLEKCIEMGAFITFGAAWKAVRGALGCAEQQFKRGESSQQVITLFQQVLPGSDALLVNSEGTYSRSAPDSHYQWLKEQGYKKTPARKQSKQGQGLSL